MDDLLVNEIAKLYSQAPFEKRVYVKLFDALEPKYSRTQIRKAVSWICNSQSYHKKAAAAVTRYGLDGKEAEPMTNDEQDYHRSKLSAVAKPVKQNIKMPVLGSKRKILTMKPTDNSDQFAALFQKCKQNERAAVIVILQAMVNSNSK